MVFHVIRLVELVLPTATAARTEPRVDLGLGHSEVAAKRATRRATRFPCTAGRRSPPKHHETPTSARSSQLYPERRRVSGAVPRGSGVASAVAAADLRPVTGRRMQSSKVIHEKTRRTDLDPRSICARGVRCD